MRLEVTILWASIHTGRRRVLPAPRPSLGVTKTSSTGQRGSQGRQIGTARPAGRRQGTPDK